jgi:ATP-dependent protease HslVU (ClpYQ) peptidase subunit
MNPFSEQRSGESRVSDLEACQQRATQISRDWREGNQGSERAQVLVLVRSRHGVYIVLSNEETKRLSQTSTRSGNRRIVS